VVVVDPSIGGAPPALGHVDFGVGDWLIRRLAGEVSKPVEVSGYITSRVTVRQKGSQSRRSMAQLVELSFGQLSYYDWLGSSETV
jgi:hypothetical protein